MTNSDRAKQYMAKRETSSLSSSASKAEGKKNSDRAKAYMLGKQYNFSNISSDEETVRKLLTSTYEGWQSADTMTSNKTAISNMYKRLDAYRTINGTNDDLDSLIGVYRSALDNWDNLTNAYGQYQNADAYASAQRQSEYAKKYSGKSYEEIQTAIKNATGDELDYLKGYTAYSSAEDFEKALGNADKTTKWGKVTPTASAIGNLWQAVSGRTSEYGDLASAYESFSRENPWDKYKNAPQTDATFHLVADNVTGQQSQMELNYAENNGLTYVQMDKDLINQYNNLSAEEKNMANYAYSIDGWQGLQKLLTNINRKESKEKVETAVEGIKDWSEDKWYKDLGYSLASVVGKAAAAPQVMGESIEGAILNTAYSIDGHGDATPYNPYGNASGVNLILDKGREAISEDYSSVGKFAYQTAMSTLDSYVGGKTFGLAYAPMMGTSAYSSTYAEALDKGLTADKANLIALSSGTAEALFEYVSLDKLLTEKNITGIKSWVKETLKQAGVEGSEEVFTEIANIVADGMINGSNSDYGKLYSQFIEQGYSEEEARKLVALQASKDVALAGIGGAISGGLMGGVENAVQGARLKESGRTVDTATLRDAVKGTIFADELSQLEADFHGVSKTDSYYARLADIADRYETSYGEITESYHKEVSKAIKKGDINTALTTPKTQKLYDKIRSKRKNKANQFSYEELQKKTEKFFVGESTKYEGNDIKIADVKVDGETVSLTDTDGNTYDAKTVELSPADSLMVATAESIEDDAKRSAYVKNFDGQNVALYNDAFEYVWTAAEKSGAEFDFTSIAKTFDDSSISKATIASIYEASKMAQKTAMDSLDKAISEIKHVSSKGSTNGKFIDDTDYDSLTFTEKQLYKFAQALSLKGINVKVYKDVSETSSNGFYAKYDADTKELLNRIDINLAARQFFDVENNSRTYVINTMAHELTHFIAQNAEEEYKELYKLIRDYYGEEQWNTFVNKQISDDKDAYVKEHGSEEGYTAMAREIAEEEVIARACEDMMSDEKMVAEVFKNVTVDVAQSLKAKIKKWFDEAIAFIKKFMSGITGTNEMSEMLSKDLEVLEKAKEVWLKGIDKAMARSRDINASLARVNVEITKEGYAVETRNSQKTFKASEYSTNLEKAAKDLAEAMECTVEEAKQYIKDVGSIANKIAKDQERLDYIASEGLSAWVSNPEYGGSLDYSFLCPKRLTYTGTMNAILKKQNDLIFSVDDFLWLRKALINSGYEAPCSFCFVESARARFGKYNEQFLQIAKDEKLSYIPTAEDLTNPDMLEKMRSEHKETYNRYVKFLNSLSQRKPKMLEERRAYDGDILKAFLGKEDTIASKNIHGGIRFNSFSDFEVVHMIDCMQAILDMSRVGLAGFGYTKQKAFAEVFGNTGLKINCSTVAKGVDSNGKIIFDDIEGMNHKDALKLRNNNVGICCVVFTDEQLKAALVDDRIDYVLPFHRSQWSKKEYARMGLSMDTKDFTKAQTEKLGTKKSPDGNIPFLSYWNPNQTGAETVQKYLDIINAEGKTPLFPMALEKDASGKWIMPIGKKMKNGNYLSKEERIKEEAGKNYYKLLCEFKLYDANGNGIPQTAVKPTFNMKAANKLLKDYDGSHKTFPIAQNVVDEFETFKNTGKSELVPDWESLRNTRKSVKVNSEGTALTKGQQEFFKDSKVVDDQGRLKVMYHGSRAAGFSVFQTMYSDDNRSFFFTDSKDVAVEYGNSDIEFIPDKEYSFEELSDMITYFTKGEQSIAKDGNKIVLSYHDEETYEEKTKTYDSLESARDGFFDYLENWRGVNARATYKVYLNLVDPLVIDAKGNGWSVIPFDTKTSVRYIKSSDNYEYEKDGKTRLVHPADIVYLASDEVIEKALSNPGEKVSINTASTRILAEYANEHGYDGVIINNVIDTLDDSLNVSSVAIAFNSNQIKSVNNANPTDNADIRKSVKVNNINDVEYLKLAQNPEVNEERLREMVENAAREAGFDSPMLFHGTSRFGFTTINVNIDGGFFASSSSKVGGTYVNGVRGVRKTIGKQSELKKLGLHNVSDSELLEFAQGLNFDNDAFNARYQRVKLNDNPKTAKKYRYLYDAWGFGEYKKLEAFSLRLMIDHDMAYDKNYRNADIGGLYSLYADTSNMVTIDMKGRAWNEITPAKMRKALGLTDEELPKGKHYETNDIVYIASKKGTFSGLILKNIDDAGVSIAESIADDYIFFNPTEQLKSADLVTYDDNDEIIPLSERFDRSNDDIRYSKKTNAPAFYSKMSREIDAIKQDRIGSASVIPYLKGKGVKDEEIKWSGIATFLEGKKSVTKAELSEFAKNSMLNIEEKVLKSSKRETYDEFLEKANKYYHFTDVDLEKYYDYNGDFIPETFAEDIKAMMYEGEIDQEGYDALWKLAKDYYESSDTRWSQYSTEGTTNYREILFKMPGSDYSNSAMNAHWDEKGVLAHARIDDMQTSNGKMLFIEEIQSDWHNAAEVKISKDKKKGYASREEIITGKTFVKLRESIGEKMSVHPQGFKNYAKWFNETAKMAGIELKIESSNGRYYLLNMGFIELNVDDYSDFRNGLFDFLSDADYEYNTINSNVPEAPFSNGKYIEYVMKRLIRMAAEEGYDSIGWTTAKMQEDRWSDEYAEGYRIEYDQDIPKFMQKYGKQWGVKVEKINSSSYEKGSFEKADAKFNADLESNSESYDSLAENLRNIKPYYDNPFRVYGDASDIATAQMWIRTGSINFMSAEFMLKAINLIKKMGLSERVAETRRLYEERLNAVENKESNIEIWSASLTPAMKESVLTEGQPMYSKKVERANVELGTLFSGADTFAFAINGFIHTQFAAENRPDIVGVYNMNHGGIVFENVLNINSKDMPKIQHLQVSPPCINLSSMNNDRREKPIDRKLATKVAEIITEVRPRAVTIENVEGYMKSESMGIIRKALEDAGYKDIDVDIYKDADYGGYTSRERVILRAMRDEELPAVKGKVSKHKGWIEAVGADYLESLPNAKTVNPRMIESLKRYNGINPYKVSKPLFVFGESYKNKQFGHAYANETLPTIIAESGASRVFLPGGTVKEVTPEMLAKLMGLDGFKLPDSKVLARRVIGNGIPAAITQNVMGPLIEQIQTDNAERIARGEEIRYSKKTTAQERHEKVVAIDSITREAKTLATWMSENSGKHAVPVELQIPVGELLNAIDFSSKQLLGMREGKPNNGKPTQNDISLAKAMNKMNVILTRTVTAQENGTDEATLTKWLDLPDGFDKIFNILTAKVNDLALSQMDNANALQEMSLEELKALNEAIKSIKSSVQTMNDLLAGINAHKVDGVGHKSMGELDEVARRERETKLQKGAASITDFMDFTNGVPQYVFEHLGDGALEMFNEIKAGWSKYAFRANEVIEFANAAFTEDQVKEWSKEEHTFNLVSGSVTMTTAQLMSLYCLSKREQARGHIFGGGIAVGGYDTVDAENGKKKLRVKKQGTRTVAESELEMMLSELTSEQKAVADTLQKYMTTTLANWGNEISMKRFGILQFAEENYFPIKANNTILNAEPRDSQKSIYALLNMGFTKALTDNANNEIIINSIFTEFTEHAGNMAKYNSLALPVLDLVKWFNYKEKIQNEDKTHVVNSVRKSLEGAYGTAAEQYIRHLLYDLNGQREMARGEDLIGKFMRGYKISAVAANLQVALLQPLSYARAAYVMDVKYLQKGLTRKPQIEKCQQYSGIALWKIKLGFYDTDISRGLDRMILHNDSTKDKVIDASGKFAEWGDTLTWGVIWNACEAEVMDKNPNLAYNSDEFNKKVAKRFDDVIFHTQVVDSTITRSDIMRGTTIAVKTITSFMSEPTLALNMLHDGMFRFRQTYAKTKNMGEAMKQHGKRISRAVAVYAVSSLLESLLRAGVSKWRNPEDDEKWAEKVIYNFRSELNVLRKIPIIKEIFDMMDGYKSTRMDTQVMQSSVDAGKAVLKSIQDGEFSYKAVYKMLVAISQATGLPMSNALREIEAVWNNSIGRMYPELYWKR